MNRSYFWLSGFLCLLATQTPAPAAPVRGQFHIETANAEKQTARAYWRLENRLLPIGKRRYDARQEYVVIFTGENKTVKENADLVTTLEFDGLRLKTAVTTAPPFGVLKIKNGDRFSHTPYIFAVPESDPKADPIVVVPPEPIAPGQTRSIKIPPAGHYSIRDQEFPHVEGYLLVVTTPYVVRVDEQGNFKTDLPPGKYAMRVFQNGVWQQTTPVQVDVKGVDLTAQLAGDTAPPPPPPINQFGAH